jgi:hypothetical protein
MPAMTSLSVPATEGAAARNLLRESRERKNEVRAAVFMALLAVSFLFLVQDVSFRVCLQAQGERCKWAHAWCRYKWGFSRCSPRSVLTKRKSF